MGHHRVRSSPLTTVRAGLSVALLLGFYAYAFGLVAGLAVVTVVLVNVGLSALVGKLGVVTLGLAGAIGYATWKVLRARPAPAPGLPLAEHQEPGLWAEVRALAARVGTRPPDEIRLVAEVNAAVSEDARLLGLRDGRRYLYLGVPLLQAMSVAQVRSVLAHELGHYSHQHTRLGELTYRGTRTIVHTIARVGPTSGPGWLLRGYAALYRLASAAVSRAQELEADRASVRVAGRAAAASALRELPVLAAAWEFYLETYVGTGRDSGYAPVDVLAHFPTLLAARADELAGLRAQGVPEHRSPWDSHPPLAERIALIEREPAGPAMGDGRPARVLLRDLGAAASALEDAVLDVGDRTRLPFPDYTAAAMQWQTQQGADVLYRAVARLPGSGEPHLGLVLDLLAAGRGDELRRLLLRPAELADPATADQRFGWYLQAALAAAIVRAGAARWRHSWSGPVTLVDVAGTPVEVDQLAAAAAAGQVAQVRARLAGWRVDLTAATRAEASATATGAEPVAGIVNAKVDGARRDLVILTTGLVIVPGMPRLRMRRAKQRMQHLLTGVRPEELAGTPGHRFVPYEEIAAGALVRRMPVTYELTLHSGGRLRIRWGGESEELGPGWEMLGRLVGSLRPVG